MSDALACARRRSFPVQAKGCIGLALIVRTPGSLLLRVEVGLWVRQCHIQYSLPHRLHAVGGDGSFFTDYH